MVVSATPSRTVAIPHLKLRPYPHGKAKTGDIYSDRLGENWAISEKINK